MCTPMPDHACLEGCHCDECCRDAPLGFPGSECSGEIHACFCGPDEDE